MQKKCFCDTSSIVSCPTEIFNLYDKVYISGYVLEELRRLKDDSQNKRKQKLATIASRVLEENEDKIKYIINETKWDLPDDFDKRIIDNKILQNYKSLRETDTSVIFLCEDILFRQKCKKLEFPYKKCESENKTEIYKGYKELSLDTDSINNLFDNITKGINEHDFVINEYLILHNTDLNKTTEHRFDGKEFVKLKLPDSKVVKGKNSLQRCSLDLLHNKNIPIVAINGTVGSGKTYLCTQVALHHVCDKGYNGKILTVREVIGEGKEVGFLKGTFEDKTEVFFKPIEQSLKDKEQDFQSLIQQGMLESNIPFYLKGTTYDDTIIIVDEAEDFKRSQIKLVGTRLGTNSRIFFAGDYKQSSIDSSENNALVQMCNELKGNEKFGCIYLDDDVRSEASKIFANLFEKDTS